MAGSKVATVRQFISFSFNSILVNSFRLWTHFLTLPIGLISALLLFFRLFVTNNYVNDWLILPSYLVQHSSLQLKPILLLLSAFFLGFIRYAELFLVLSTGKTEAEGLESKQDISFSFPFVYVFILINNFFWLMCEPLYLLNRIE